MTIENDFRQYCKQQGKFTERINTLPKFQEIEDIASKYAARIPDHAGREFFAGSNVLVETHPVRISIDGKSKEFVLQGTGISLKQPSLSNLPEFFEHISICPTRGEGVHLPPLYTFYPSGRFDFLSNETVDSEKKMSAWGLLGQIEKKLAEAHPSLALAH